MRATVPEAPSGQSATGGSSESAFLSGLFRALNEGGCVYAVMRNYEGLPLSVHGSDLDILVHRDDSTRAVDQLMRVVESMGAVVLGQSSSGGFRKFFVMGRGGGDAYWGLSIDLNIDLAYKGASLLVDDFSEAVVACKGLSVLRADLASVLGVLKEVLNNGRVPERYLAEARAAAEGGWEPLGRLLSPMGRTALENFRALLLMKSSGTCAADSRRLRSQLAWHAWHADGTGYFKRRWLFEFSKFRRFVSPSGAMVAILGVDGVGKTTVIDGVRPVLVEATHGACQFRHLRPGLLPPLSRLKGVRQSEPGPTDDPHGSEPSGALGSLARIGWLLADYLIGYWLRVRPFIAKQPAIFLFDRYAYDMAIDPKRFRIALPERLNWWLARLAPRPDLVVCLHASPSTILSRKQELPEQEVRRQLDALAAFAAREPRAVLVSTEGTPREVRERVLQVLYDFFDKRARARRFRGDAT